MFCPYCGNACEEGHRFCFRCGKSLPEITTETAEAAVEFSAASAESEILSEPAETSAEESMIPVSEENTSASSRSEDLSSQPESIDLSDEPKEPKGRLWPPLLMLGVIACVGLLVFFLSNFQPAPEIQSETPWFSVENGVLDFHPEYYTGDAELTIPSMIDGQTVTAIANHAFSGCDLISTVILPDTVIRIGDYAFSSCHKLRGIYIPESVDLIGVYAFADCNALEAIYIPGDLEGIGEGALDSCDKLRFILFNGTCAQWNQLYEGRFTSEVELHATDGVFYAQP